jgi:hypothetical protein
MITIIIIAHKLNYRQCRQILQRALSTGSKDILHGASLSDLIEFGWH